MPPNNPINILQLQFLEGQTTNTDGNEYYWPLKPLNESDSWKKVLVRGINFPFKWYLFNNEPLLWSGGTATLNGSFDAIELPIALAILFTATSCTVSASTNKISMTFAGATTLNISSWSRRARYFLGSGDADLTGVTIDFPYPADLGGDDNLNFIFDNGLTSENRTGLRAVSNSLVVPVPCNPQGYVYWEPQQPYELDINQPMNYTSLTLRIYDQWGNPVNMNNAQGYIQLELYPSCYCF